jgi:tubulin-specific chaperone A
MDYSIFLVSLPSMVHHCGVRQTLTCVRPRLPIELYSLIKECEYYKREVEENQQKLEQMIHEGRDPYDIKKFREVLGESEMMVPDSARRMQQAVLDLQTFIGENQNLEEGEWQEPARRILLDYAPETSKGVDLCCDEARVVETNVSDLADGEIF